MPKGTIDSLHSDRGFIRTNRDKKLFFPSARVAPGTNFKDLHVGATVEYESEQEPDGRWRAINVRLISSPANTSLPGGMAQTSKNPSVASSRVEYKFLNPYNFVRFLPAPVQFEFTPEQQLLSRCAPPPHDRYIGLTGELTCTLKSVTPLFISDPRFVSEDDQGHRSYRFFQINDQYTIPATALRGVTRSVLETATNSCLSVFEGQRLSYHFNPKLAPTLVPARVEKDDEKWRLRLLTGTARLGKDYAPEKGETLPAAWLYRYWPIEPSKTLKDDPQENQQNIERILDFQDRADAGPVDLQDFKHGDRCYALLERTRHPHPRIIFWDVWKLSKDRQALEEKKKNQQRIVEGWLCLTNQNIEPKHSERFFFVDPKQRQLPETIELPEAARKAYEDLIKDYQERHDKERKEAHGRDDLRTGVCDDDALQLSRFVHNDEERKLRGGELVYARLTGSFAKPTVEFIAPVSVPRVSYDKSIAKIVEEQHKHLQACDKYDELCPACRVFGWVHQNSTELPKSSKVAYAGRVRFSHATLVGKPRRLDEQVPLAILSSPKPTTSKFYLLDGNKPSADVDYDSPNARLRGRKFYRHHGKANRNEYRRAVDADHSGKDKQNRTLVDALDKDNEFTFTVQFENLAPVELGALLWALEMDGKGVQRLGFAKPLGFGAVEVKVTDLKILDPSRRYSSLSDVGWMDATAKRAQCVEKFKAALSSLYGKADFELLENIIDLRLLLQSPSNECIHYPRPSKEPNAKGEQFKWFVATKGQYPLPLPENEDGLPLAGSAGRPG